MCVVLCPALVCPLVGGQCGWQASPPRASRCLGIAQHPRLGWLWTGWTQQQLLLGNRGRSGDSGTQGNTQQAALTSAQHDPLLHTAPWEQTETTQGVVETTCRTDWEARRGSSLLMGENKVGWTLAERSTSEPSQQAAQWLGPCTHVSKGTHAFSGTQRRKTF